MCLISCREEFLVWVIFHYHHHCGHLVCKKSSEFTIYHICMSFIPIWYDLFSYKLHHSHNLVFLVPKFPSFEFPPCDQNALQQWISPGTTWARPSTAGRPPDWTWRSGTSPVRRYRAAPADLLRSAPLCVATRSSPRPTLSHTRSHPLFLPHAGKVGSGKKFRGSRRSWSSSRPNFSFFPTHLKLVMPCCESQTHTHAPRARARVEDPTNLQLRTLRGRAFFKIKVAFKCGRTIGRFCCHSSPQDCALTPKQAWSELANSAPRWWRHILA